MREGQGRTGRVGNFLLGLGDWGMGFFGTSWGFHRNSIGI
jgi:hypothetical protein